MLFAAKFIVFLLLGIQCYGLILNKSDSTTNSSATPVKGIANATSGYLSVNDPNTDSKLFYIFYQCRGLAPGKAPSSVPLIIWIQGGRGDGSEIGNFFEIGPYYLGSNGKEARREVSWNDDYNLLFIDSPRGSGYSIADKDTFATSADDVAQDFVHALLNFYSLDDFQAFQKTPLYLFGQGFAGYYIPSMVEKIIDYNSQKPSFLIPFVGLGLGNGFTDPLHQLTGNGLFGFSRALIDDLQKEDIETLQLQGIEEIFKQNYVGAQNYFDRVINVISSYAGGVNIYNYRQFGSYDFSSLVSFMNNPDTIQRYNIDPKVAGKFAESNPSIFSKVLGNLMQNSTSQILRILNSGFPVLFFNGQDDLICNTPGVQSWITNLPWIWQEQYYQSAFNVWVAKSGMIAGLQKSYNNLFFAIVHNAGHYAPMDQIEITTEMLNRFITNQKNWSLPFNSQFSNKEILVK